MAAADMMNGLDEGGPEAQTVILGMGGRIIGTAKTVGEALSLAMSISSAAACELGIIVDVDNVIFGDAVTEELGRIFLNDSTTIILREDPWKGPFLAALSFDNGDTANVSDQKLEELPSAVFRDDVRFSDVRNFLADDNELRRLPASFAALERLEQLSLSSNRFGQVPNQVLTFRTTLTHLSLQRNLLVALPDWINELTNLRVLDVSQNRLRSFPLISGGFESLQTLDVAYNQIRHLRTIVSLSALTALSVSSNPLRELPDELSRHVVEMTARRTTIAAFMKSPMVVDLVMTGSSLRCLRKITHSVHLMRLIIDGNDLMALPEDMCCNLVLLEEMNVANNRLTHLPVNLGLLRSLKSLEASHNRLRVLPSSTCALVALELLNLEDNTLTSLPAQLGFLACLRALNVEQNRLRSLPRSLSRAMSLQSLRVRNNPLERLPPALTKHKVTVHRI